jgi:hypothetical protein
MPHPRQALVHTLFLVANGLLLGMLLSLVSPTARAITFANGPAEPEVSWVSAQRPHTVDCEMRGANGRFVYIGPCQNGLPHGRGLLLSADKGIEGVKMDRGTPYARVPHAALQDVQTHVERARYLLAFHRIGWSPDGFGQVPGPNGSKVSAAAQQFIAQWGERDPDGLVAEAKEAMAQATVRAQAQAWGYFRQSDTGADDIQYRLREWEGVASAEQMAEARQIAAQRLRRAYDRDFAAIQGERSAALFVQAYAGYDPDGRLPQARARLAAYAQERRRQAEAEAQAEAAKRRREAANPVCMAQKQSCMAQCAVYADDSARWRCEFACERIRCD